MIPAYYVKADGTICMTYTMFRALDTETLTRELTRARKPLAKQHAQQRAEKTLVLAFSL